LKFFIILALKVRNYVGVIQLYYL